MTSAITPKQIHARFEQFRGENTAELKPKIARSKDRKMRIELTAKFFNVSTDIIWDAIQKVETEIRMQKDFG